MNSDSTAVFVVDDDASVRHSLESLLRSVGHLVQSFESTEALLAAERPDLPACLVLDVRLRGRSGLEFVSDPSFAALALPVVFVTAHGDIPMSVTAMKAGAIEFLTKPFRDQDLLDAVHRGLALDRHRRAEASALAEIAAREATLTAREREVMALVAEGRLNKQIAAELGLSEMTVKVHRAQVMRKMQAGSLPELVRLADRLEAESRKA
ncbi:two component transcriptional regulator, LuxR family [Tistlia consotensis]|uniref:Two component transcriptional regulator, LuxR family n=1 Tax=Tistlia consotensis USBA 355 TaxID=560819 RepID=A0A1Y6BCG6_9PROT|nr:response regulator [Tistlia consotensis]SMF03808.1 two component transcriptional regulator, LuxR family [Tistlia consotensis USBA 355]SNR54061.1 two component transcriptional regulator, LuxR family [Tistlia consotensis]